MERHQVCLWIDNCYIRQYGFHPTVADQSQNCTAICVTEVPSRLPYFRGHLTLDTLIGGIQEGAFGLARMKRSFHGIVTDLRFLDDRPTTMHGIHASLDMFSHPTPSPGWKPLVLSTEQVGSHGGLIQLLDYGTTLSTHCHPIVCVSPRANRCTPTKPPSGAHTNICANNISALSPHIQRCRLRLARPT